MRSNVFYAIAPPIFGGVGYGSSQARRATTWGTRSIDRHATAICFAPNADTAGRPSMCTPAPAIAVACWKKITGHGLRTTAWSARSANWLSGCASNLRENSPPHASLKRLKSERRSARRTGWQSHCLWVRGCLCSPHGRPRYRPSGGALVNLNSSRANEESGNKGETFLALGCPLTYNSSRIYSPLRKRDGRLYFRCSLVSAQARERGLEGFFRHFSGCHTSRMCIDSILGSPRHKPTGHSSRSGSL